MPKNTFILFAALFVIGLILINTVEGGFLRGFGISTSLLSPIFLLFLWVEARRNKRKN